MYCHIYKISHTFAEYNEPGHIKIHINHQELATKIRHKQIGCISVIRVSTVLDFFSHYWKFIQDFGDHKFEVLVGPIFELE